MWFRKNYVQEESIPIYCEHNYFQGLHVMLVNYFLPEKELVFRQRQGRGKAVNDTQVRVHMQIVVEVLRRQRQGKCEAVND